MDSTRTISTGLVAVITVLAGLFAGAVTTTANYYFQRKAAEQKRWATKRTESYLAFIDNDRRVGQLQKAIRGWTGGDLSVCENRERLRQDTKLEKLCDKHAEEQALSIALRYKMAIYGSPKVLDAYATHLRAQNIYQTAREERRPTEAIQMAGKLRRDTFASMLREMRAEVFEDVVTPDRDILTIMCPNRGNCFGFDDRDPAHLALSK